MQIPSRLVDCIPTQSVNAVKKKTSSPAGEGWGEEDQK